MTDKKVFEVVNKDFKPDYPYVTRHHIYPGHILIGYLIPICQCHQRKNNGYDYCETCGYAIPTKRELEGKFNLKDDC